MGCLDTSRFGHPVLAKRLSSKNRMFRGATSASCQRTHYGLHIVDVSTTSRSDHVALVKRIVQQEKNLRSSNTEKRNVHTESDRQAGGLTDLNPSPPISFHPLWLTRADPLWLAECPFLTTQSDPPVTGPVAFSPPPWDWGDSVFVCPES